MGGFFVGYLGFVRLNIHIGWHFVSHDDKLWGDGDDRNDESDENNDGNSFTSLKRDTLMPTSMDSFIYNTLYTAIKKAV